MSNERLPNIEIEGSTLKVNDTIYALRNIVGVSKRTKSEHMDVTPIISIGICCTAVAVFFYKKEALFTLDMPKNLTTIFGAIGGALLISGFILGRPKKYHYLKLNVGSEKEIDLVKTKSLDFVTQTRDEIAFAIKNLSVNVRFRPSYQDRN